MWCWANWFGCVFLGNSRSNIVKFDRNQHCMFGIARIVFSEWFISTEHALNLISWIHVAINQTKILYENKYELKSVLYQFNSIFHFIQKMQKLWGVICTTRILVLFFPMPTNSVSIDWFISIFHNSDLFISSVCCVVFNVLFVYLRWSYSTLAGVHISIWYHYHFSFTFFLYFFHFIIMRTHFDRFNIWCVCWWWSIANKH